MLAIAVIVGPKILLLLPVWLLGVAVYRRNTRGPLGAGSGALLFGGSIALYAAFRACGLRDALLEWTYALLGKGFVRGELMWSDEFLSAQVIGLLVACNFVGFFALSDRLAPWMARGERVIRDWAGYTFSIYLFHYPLLQLLAALSPIPPDSPAAAPVLFVLTVLGCRLLGTFTEQRKDLARTCVRRLIPAAR
jgi:peptidoglycan/LPS O-acetylase OafA/YrhL